MISTPADTPRSDWLPVAVKPIRIGHYEFAYWSDAHQRHSPPAVTGHGANCDAGRFPEDCWRGLASDPAR